MTEYKLTYFDIMGLGESVRLMLSYLGVDFEDNRILDYSEWLNKIKATMPFGKLPLLEIDGQKVHQTIAICRYLGKKANLAGENDWEALQIDIVIDTLSDFRVAIWAYFYTRDKEIKNKLHGPLMETTMPFYLQKFNDLIKDNGGYLANGKLSWGDIYFVSVLEYFSFMLDKFDIISHYPHIKALNDKVTSIPKIRSWLQKRPKSDW